MPFFFLPILPSSYSTILLVLIERGATSTKSFRPLDFCYH
uniref:Uncharacterized protein n=1 Tax=Arundo donax TaxID=35708 RepID=A0A0A9ALW9_ARUDO